MLASDASDIAVAAITAFAGIVAATVAATAAIFVARSQRAPKIVTPIPADDPRVTIATLEAKVVQLEAERDVWKEIALETRRGHPGVDPPDPGLPD